jgi:hypothetical protein
MGMWIHRAAVGRCCTCCRAHVNVWVLHRSELVGVDEEMTTWIPTDWPKKLKLRVIRDRDFTDKEHAQRSKVMCGTCNAIGFNKYHTCIHTAECTYEYLQLKGELLPETQMEDIKIGDISWGLYLLYKNPRYPEGGRQ